PGGPAQDHDRACHPVSWRPTARRAVGGQRTRRRSATASRTRATAPRWVAPAGFGGWPRPADACSSSRDPVPLQLVVERALADAELLRGASAVAAGLLEGAPDRGGLEVRDRAAQGQRRRRRGVADEDLVAADHVAIGQDGGAFEGVGQLAHVAVPRRLEDLAPCAL